MHIKKIEIDGFKSYSQKQVVDRFDEQFNAITGLNGSGKSNILDSICFVLGITDLKCIRAENMNALVYKQGQAGINKASVTITFDNTDKKSGPLGYNAYDEIIVRRQVIVNGRNSYTINGSAITNNKVSDFFRGVGLNVNNPHFLIMQGRITKVLNMKPHEILGMVEEAAGTKMYETKRQAAMNTIEKKQSKVNEINKLMDEEIQPQVEKLKADRDNYRLWKACDRDIDMAKRKLSAFTYNDCLKHIDIHLASINKLEASVEDCNTRIAQNAESESKIAEELKELENQKTAKNAAGRDEVEEAVRKSQEELVAVEGDKDEVDEEIKNAKVEVDRKNKSIQEDKKELKKKENELQKKEKEIGGEEDVGNKAEETVRIAKAKLEALAKGLTTDDQGQTVTLEAQITATRSQLSEITTDVRKAEIKQKRLVPELKKKKADLAALEKQKSSEGTELQHREKEVAKYEDQLSKLSFDPAEESQLREKLPNLKAEQHLLRQKLAQITQRDTRLDFQYTPPWPNFNHKAEIHGVLATLFTIKDPKYATALETAASSLVYNVVCTKASTACTLVQKKLMSMRRTFLPLDKLLNKPIQQLGTRIELAKKVADQQKPGTVVMHALDLVECDPQYQKCMENVFSGILVVDDPTVANHLAFHPHIKLRTVTLRGDDNKPAGTVSGGAREKRTPVLEIMLPYAGYKKDLETVTEEIDQIERRLAEMEPNRRVYTEAKDSLDRAMGRLNTLRENLKNSPLQVLRDEIAAMEKELPVCEEVINNNAQKMKELSTKIKEYEDRKKNEKAFQEREKKVIQKELDAAENTLKTLKGSFEKTKATLTTVRAEVDALRAQIASDETETVRLEALMEELGKTLGEKDALVKEKKAEVAVAQKALDAFMGQLREHDEQIKKAQRRLDATKKDSQKASNEKESHERNLKKSETDLEQYRKIAAAELKNNPWIEDEKMHFGQKGTDYDFDNYNRDKGTSQIQAIETRKKELERKLNTKAMHILGQAEEQVMNLKKKKAQIEIDKQKLLETIETLDEKKKSEILKAHTQVNRDFGNIFSTLLPGTTAKLDPPEGKTALQGLEVKVAFNGKWKDSLNELSGGQRSLVALSLVLAMLKFKPAPIYILDEVDSALDLSHTQNIGHMIKRHFTSSQFIIVSLKEGMFNHANVLYRTRFVDGTSQVTRTENRSH